MTSYLREEKRKQKRLKKMGLTEEEEIAYRLGHTIINILPWRLPVPT